MACVCGLIWEVDIYINICMRGEHTYPLETPLHLLPRHAVVPQIHEAHGAERLVDLPRDLGPGGEVVLVTCVGAEVDDGDGWGGRHDGTYKFVDTQRL